MALWKMPVLMQDHHILSNQLLWFHITFSCFSCRRYTDWYFSFSDFQKQIRLRLGTHRDGVFLQGNLGITLDSLTNGIFPLKMSSNRNMFMMCFVQQDNP